MPWYQQPFFQVALPIVITLALAVIAQSVGFTVLGKRIDDVNSRINDLRDLMNARFDAIEKRLDKIDALLQIHDRDIAALKERTGLVKVK